MKWKNEDETRKKNEASPSVFVLYDLNEDVWVKEPRSRVGGAWKDEAPDHSV